MKSVSFRLLCVSFLLIVILGWWVGMPKFVDNSDFYIKMATGHGQTVAKPFASRILHPWAAAALIHLGTSVDVAFKTIAAIALALLFFSVGSLVRWFGPERMIWPVLLFCPILLEYYRTAYMNDLFHAALIGVLFLAMSRAKPLVLPILFVLILCRESTILVAFVLLLYFIWGKRYGYAFGGLLTVVVGFWIVSRLTPATSSNIHNLSTGAYIVQKSGWNFLANWLGLRLWRPTFEWACPVPILNARIPFLNYPIVICDWHPEFILSTWTNVLGILSLSFAFVLARWKSLFVTPISDERSKLLLTIGVYGTLAALVGTFTGTATHRLVGYGWPLIWIFVPVLFNTVLRSINPGWLWLHWSLMWLRAAIPAELIWIELIFCAGVIALNVWVYRRITLFLGEQQAAPAALFVDA